jgi:NADH-quinone oxidoreductase subunit J
MNTLFYIASAVAVISTLMVITRLNVVHALLYLIVSLLSVSVIFFILGAPFAAALEVIIYAGAIMVLFVFVIMMFNLGAETAKQEGRWLVPELWLGPSLLTAVLLGELIYLFAKAGSGTYSAAVVGSREVGITLLGPYVLGAELASFLLLAGLVGALHLGRRDDRRKGGNA